MIYGHSSDFVEVCQLWGMYKETSPGLMSRLYGIYAGCVGESSLHPNGNVDLGVKALTALHALWGEKLEARVVSDVVCISRVQSVIRKFLGSLNGAKRGLLDHEGVPSIRHAVRQGLERLEVGRSGSQQGRPFGSRPAVEEKVFVILEDSTIDGEFKKPSWLRSIWGKANLRDRWLIECALQAISLPSADDRVGYTPTETSDRKEKDELGAQCDLPSTYFSLESESEIVMPSAEERAVAISQSRMHVLSKIDWLNDLLREEGISDSSREAIEKIRDVLPSEVSEFAS